MEKNTNLNEKAYKSMNFVGILNIALGIVVLSVSVTCSILTIITGAKLLKDKTGITF